MLVKEISESFVAIMLNLCSLWSIYRLRGVLSGCKTWQPNSCFFVGTWGLHWLYLNAVGFNNLVVPVGMRSFCWSICFRHDWAVCQCVICKSLTRLWPLVSLEQACMHLLDQMIDLSLLSPVMSCSCIWRAKKCCQPVMSPNLRVFVAEQASVIMLVNWGNHKVGSIVSILC